MTVLAFEVLRALERRFILLGQDRMAARVDDRHQRQQHGGGGEQREDRVKLGGDGERGKADHGPLAAIRR